MTRTCTKCHETKSIDDFYLRSPANGGGFARHCKECHKKRSAANARARLDRDLHGERHRRRLWAHGLSAAGFDALMDAQGNRCAMCALPFTGPLDAHVDHDHQARTVRGLLCGHCNNVLGMARDNPDVLRAGIAYLASPPADNVLPGHPEYAHKRPRTQPRSHRSTEAAIA